MIVSQVIVTVLSLRQCSYCSRSIGSSKSESRYNMNNITQVAFSFFYIDTTRFKRRPIHRIQTKQRSHFLCPAALKIAKIIRVGCAAADKDDIYPTAIGVSRMLCVSLRSTPTVSLQYAGRTIGNESITVIKIETSTLIPRRS
uniref:AlNc14C205G8791 protein n=1 Tax=Albugo laibachii Nc14 TaxID=890382 RepID=F0WQY3_9STRA|nr:AlNc14C205G8791 [Albugo laibachii Nc14]|eukprot:CCA23743.1 AlNc14C205G8791 [Albugo laibachii Nc14]